MKTIYLKALVIASIFFSFIIDENDKFEENRSLKNFNSISLSVRAQVYVSQKDTYAVKIISNCSEIINEIETKVSGGTLSIYCNKPSRLWRQKNLQIKIFIALPEIEKLNVTGSGTIRAKKITSEKNNFAVVGSGTIIIEELITQSLKSSVTGSGDLKIENVIAKSVNASVAGSGDIQLASNETIEIANFDISGSGDIKAKNLKVINANASIAGSGDIVLNVKENLKAVVVGSGDIRYFGNPKNIDSNVTGSGTVRSGN